MATLPNIIADFTTQLAAAIAVGGTTGTLVSNTDDDGNVLPDGLYYFTIDGNTSNKEHITATKTGTSLTNISSVSRQAIATSGAVRAHRIGALVVMTDFATYKAYMDASALQGAANASATVAGITKLSVAPTVPTVPVAVGANNTASGTPISGSNAVIDAAYSIPGTLISGLISPYAGRSAPAGWLLCDGSAVSRATYAALLSVIAPSQSYTATSASPTVITATAHGLVAGDRVSFTTNTGGHGIAAGTDYYVLAAGLTTNAFEIGLSPSGTAINTSGTESGTLYKSAFGCGDGSTTFNVPDLRGKIPLSIGGASTWSLPFEVAAVGTNTIAVPDGNYPVQGQVVTLTGTLPTGLSTSTSYYVIRASSTSIKLASSQSSADAATPSPISFTSSGMSGVCTIVYTTTARTVIGRAFGEETHGLGVSEIPSHIHTVPLQSVGSDTGNNSATLATSGSSNTGSTGGDTQHNIMQPSLGINYIIKT